MGRAIITTKNGNLQKINTTVGAMTPVNSIENCSSDKAENNGENRPRYPVEMLNTLTGGSALSDHRFLLKKRYPVMLLRNVVPTNVQ